jgi:hypothetical protein
VLLLVRIYFVYFSLLGASLLGTAQNATTTLGGAGGGLLEHSLGGLGNAGNVLASDAALGGLAGHLTGGRAGHGFVLLFVLLYKLFISDIFSRIFPFLLSFTR